MIELLKELENPDGGNVKQKIEAILHKAYIGICELRKQTLEKKLTIEFIEEVEEIFNKNQINLEELNFNNRYLLILLSVTNTKLFLRQQS